jgi:hypothetical protein
MGVHEASAREHARSRSRRGVERRAWNTDRRRDASATHRRR